MAHILLRRRPWFEAAGVRPLRNHPEHGDWSLQAQPPDPIAPPATRTELHEKGIFTDQQFEA